MQQDFINDIPVDNKTFTDIINEIDLAIKNKEKYTIFSINPKKIVFSMENATLKKGLIDASCHIPDGALVVQKCKYINKRLTGVDLMAKICENSHKINGKIFLYGAREEILKKAEINLKEKYPQLKIVGRINGYVSSEEAIAAINKSKANIVFVAMGSPKQELWIIENQDKIKANILMGVGGSFDIYSGTKKRAPKIFLKLNIEWLYRVITEPKRFKDTFIYLKYFLKARRNK